MTKDFPIHFLKERDNLSEYPKLSPRLPFNTITSGDLHANSLKLLHFLLKNDVVYWPTEEGEPTPETLYDEFNELYNCSQDINATNLARIRALIKKLKPSKNAPFVHLLGDELGDRGENDLITLLLLDHISNLGIKYDCCFSNHTLRFTNAFLKNVKKNLPIEKDYTYTYRSLEPLFAAVKKGIINEEEVESLIDKHFAHIGFMQYGLLEDGVIQYTHAPTSHKIAQFLAKKLKTPFSDATPTDLAKSIDRINQRFFPLYKSGELLDFYNLFVIEALSDNEKQSEKEYPCENAVWNRNYVLSRPTTINNYPIYSVHGHDNKEETSLEKHIINLDAHIGKTMCRYDSETQTLQRYPIEVGDTPLFLSQERRQILELQETPEQAVAVALPYTEEQQEELRDAEKIEEVLLQLLKLRDDYEDNLESFPGYVVSLWDIRECLADDHLDQKQKKTFIEQDFPSILEIEVKKECVELLNKFKELNEPSDDLPYKTACLLIKRTNLLVRQIDLFQIKLNDEMSALVNSLVLVKEVEEKATTQILKFSSDLEVVYDFYEKLKLSHPDNPLIEVLSDHLISISEKRIDCRPTLYLNQIDQFEQTKIALITQEIESINQLISQGLTQESLSKAEERINIARQVAGARKLQNKIQELEETLDTKKTHLAIDQQLHKCRADLLAHYNTFEQVCTTSKNRKKTKALLALKEIIEFTPSEKTNKERLAAFHHALKDFKKTFSSKSIFRSQRFFKPHTLQSFINKVEEILNPSRPHFLIASSEIQTTRFING